MLEKSSESHCDIERIYLYNGAENKYLVNKQSSPQYFVMYHVLALTEVRGFLEVLIRFADTLAGILAHSSLQILD